MREILFRAKRVDNGEWVEGDFVSNKYILQGYRVERGFVVPYNTFEVIPETVGQYTGLTDKNGKKIFEGDIIKIYWRDGIATKGLIRYKSNWCRFVVVEDEVPYSLDNTTPFEVIGNVIDNAKLLEVEK